MVGAIFYWCCLMIVWQQLKIDKEERVWSQLDMSMKFHDVGYIYEENFKVHLKWWVVLIGFIPVVRELIGIQYLVATARGTAVRRLAIDNFKKI